MSDPKRGTLITVGAPKSAKNNVNKTVRLTINLDESNESKYPELNYKELVIAEEKKKLVENGKTKGLDPFSENEDDDVKRVARKFEQKYGGKSTYGRKGRSKHDDFADIGAGYDENDSFIDNTDGYDEMIPPECDTFYGGFYINSGSLEFKTVPENTSANSDVEMGNRRNKRRISSSSSEEESSESCSESSQDEKDTKDIANGPVDSHKTEHRKKKNKKIDKKAKKVRRTDSSAATSGKQTSDDNGHGYAESADSRTSQSDSLTSKPAPSSENAITSDSSRDVEAKVENKLPPPVTQALEALETAVARLLMDNPSTPAKELLTKMDQHILRVDRVLPKSASSRVVRAAWGRVARAVGLSTTELQLLLQLRNERPDDVQLDTQTPATTNIAQPTTASTTIHKRKADQDMEETNFHKLTDEEREAKIVETLERLKALIEDRKPAMIASYNAECERVQEERKKLQIASAAVGAPVVEKRLPKRRFPWCARARALLGRLRALAGAAGGERAAAALLAKRVLPLFPTGFVRMPTLLRQADLSKEIKATEMKRQRLGSTSLPAMPQTTQPIQFTEPIQFPSSLTVTTTTKSSPEKMEVAVGTDDSKMKTNTCINTIMSSFSISKDLIVEKPEKKDDKLKEDLYIPPNIGSITITPVPNNQSKEKKPNNVNDKHSGFIRVKSPAALNEMVNKSSKEKPKKPEKNHVKEKRIDLPLHIDTSYQSSKKEPSPKVIKDDITQKQIESMRAAENNIPRPALVPVHHSPTFAKPDKRPPEIKKKKDLVIISDVDPLGDVIQEPVSVDDSSSDVEVIEDSKVTDKSELKHSDNKCETVPLKDKSVRVDSLQKKVNNVKSKDRVKDGKPRREDDTTDTDIDMLMKNIRDMERRQKNCRKDDAVTDGKTRREDDATDEDIDTLMKNIREMENSQEPTKLNSNSFGGVISNAKHEMSSNQTPFSRPAIYGEQSVKDKFTELTSLNKMDGCSLVTG